MDDVEENTIVVNFIRFYQKKPGIIGDLCWRKRTCFSDRNHLNVNKENVEFY